MNKYTDVDMNQLTSDRRAAVAYKDLPPVWQPWNADSYKI